MSSPPENVLKLKKQWTPEDRNKFIDFAINNEYSSNEFRPYNFQYKSKRVNFISEQNYDNNDDIPHAFFKTIYMTKEKPQYKFLILNLYKQLVNKFNENYTLQYYMQKNDIKVIIKGNTANTYHFINNSQYLDNCDIEFSDLDIAILINPNLETDDFYKLFNLINIIVSQIISKYKKILDNIFFFKQTPMRSYSDEVNLEQDNIDHHSEHAISNNRLEELIIVNDHQCGRVYDNHNYLLSMFDKDDFIKDYLNNLNNIDSQNKNIKKKYITPFLNNEIRNKCSRYSYIFENSNIKNDSIVKIFLPHFEYCEKIPLHKTPIYVSYNKTIEFRRDIDELYIAKFNLFRLNICHYCEEVDILDDNTIINIKNNSLIDICILDKNDHDLIDSWNDYKYIKYYDIDVDFELEVPTVYSSIRELYKILYVYNSIDFKKEKRKKYLHKLIEIFLRSDIENIGNIKNKEIIFDILKNDWDRKKNLYKNYEKKKIFNIL